jgi:4-aminobutyrate aminotransferase-like enzyme
VLDTVFASDGLWPRGASDALDTGIAQAVRAVKAAGGLVVADEVQAGFGRVGSSLWGFSGRFTPDLVTLGKPMGNGYPVAGIVAPHKTFDMFSEVGRYFNTFGGTQAAMAAAHATWNVLHDEGLPDHASRMETLLQEAFASLASHPRVGEIRGVGLYWSVDLVNDDGHPDEAFTLECVNKMREAGVLIAASGPTNTALKIRPPLAITSDQVGRLADVLSSTIQSESDDS